MTSKQFDTVFRAFCNRRPFRKCCIEFTSGQQVIVLHPEAIRREGDLYAMRTPDGGSVVFAADSVVRFIDPPAA
ncbi:MAG: hypothetical protein HYX68_27735 [Planctomycetes bacterium]|nr:hypothetical protein [Planctomycetota bacterium]